MWGDGGGHGLEENGGMQEGVKDGRERDGVEGELEGTGGEECGGQMTGKKRHLMEEESEMGGDGMEGGRMGSGLMDGKEKQKGVEPVPGPSESMSRE
eukprot:3840541-Rhodomonas_salina.2